MRDASFTVVEDVNWSVVPGEFWVVAGQEHSGKSDLLMLAAGLMTPAAGSCRLFGSETEVLARRNWPTACAWVLFFRRADFSTS